jgi:hypothetical protein
VFKCSNVSEAGATRLGSCTSTTWDYYDGERYGIGCRLKFGIHHGETSATVSCVGLLLGHLYVAQLSALNIFVDQLRFISVWLLSWAKALIAFVTISVPRFIYFILSYSMTLTVNIHESYTTNRTPTPNTSICAVKFLVLCDNFCSFCCHVQLLASLPLSQCLFRVS